jgi:hypothetical protein
MPNFLHFLRRKLPQFFPHKEKNQQLQHYDNLVTGKMMWLLVPRLTYFVLAP